MRCNLDKILELRFFLAEGYKNKNLIPDYRDETLLSRPAKKKNRSKEPEISQKVKIDIEDVSDGKL